jgi:hypothetical protein
VLFAIINTFVFAVLCQVCLSPKGPNVFNYLLKPMTCFDSTFCRNSLPDKLEDLHAQFARSKTCVDISKGLGSSLRSLFVHIFTEVPQVYNITRHDAILAFLLSLSNSVSTPESGISVIDGGHATG